MSPGAALATPVRLPLRAPLVTARGVLRARSGELVRRPGPGGALGWGEATPAPGFADPDAFRRAAWEAAAWDRDARRTNTSLARWIANHAGTTPRSAVPVNALLAAENPDALAAEARAAVEAGFATLKLKIDGQDGGAALERVARVRKAVPGDVALRVDANGSLDPETAPALCRALASLDVEYLEEPFAPGRLDRLLALRADCELALAADESAASAEGARAVIDAAAADVLVLKPSALGIAATLDLARDAAEAGVRVTLTSALDGAVAVAAALHLAAALPGPLPACGLATGALLADDVARLPEPVDGRLALPSGPGLGIEPDPQALERLRAGPDRELAA